VPWRPAITVYEYSYRLYRIFSIEQMITRSSRYEYLSDSKGSFSAGEFRCRHAPSTCDYWQ
jgi:hypothetical protein